MDKSKGFKVTYSTLDPEGMEVFHQAYDQAVKDVTGQFGQSYPLFISGREVSAAEEFAEKLRIYRKRRMWALLCPAVHERTKPDNNGIKHSREKENES